MKSLSDMMMKTECGFSIMQEPLNWLGEGYRLMLSLMKMATLNKKLLKGNEEWDRKGALEYLDKKRRFLELLMLAMHLTGGQPARGPQLGSIKFQNSSFFLRMIGGKAFYVTEHHKGRALTTTFNFTTNPKPDNVYVLENKID